MFSALTPILIVTVTVFSVFLTAQSLVEGALAVLGSVFLAWALSR